MLNLTAQDKKDIWAEALSKYPPISSADGLEARCKMPSVLGTGYHNEIKLAPGLSLNIFEKTYHDVILRTPENQHLVQVEILLSGIIDSGDFLCQNAQRSYVGGSGIQPSFTSFYPKSQPIKGVNVHIEPQLVSQFVADSDDGFETIQQLTQTQGPQQVFTPSITPEMQRVVRQIIHCSLMGTARQFYLQGKVFELIGLQLDSLQPRQPVYSSVKAETATQIQMAAQILRSHLENPPTQKDLAQQIGISDRTLQKGFKALFGVTPFAYLTQQRMVRAEYLLREPERTVAEVANWVGYTNPAQFAAAFKRQFGITPSACKQGQSLIK